MDNKLQLLIERFKQGDPEELPELTIRLAMMLEYYSVNPAVRHSRRSEMAQIIPESLLDLEVTENDLRELISVVVVDGVAHLDLGVCFWMLGKASQALGAEAAVQLLGARWHLLSESQAYQAANTLVHLLVRPDSKLKPQLRSEWFRSVLRQWLASDFEDLKGSAEALKQRLATAWAIRSI